jgi:hypothetical protein
MAVDQKIRDVLKLSKLRSKLPKNPKLVDIRVEEDVDTDGKDALRIWVILDEGVDLEHLKPEDTMAVKRVIRDRVFGLDVDLWPYFHMAKQSEFDED